MPLASGCIVMGLSFSWQAGQCLRSCVPAAEAQSINATLTLRQFFRKPFYRKHFSVKKLTAMVSIL
jgi:hypothetical protein